MNSYDHFIYEFICYEFMYMKKCMNYITYECISWRSIHTWIHVIILWFTKSQCPAWLAVTLPRPPQRPQWLVPDWNRQALRPSAMAIIDSSDLNFGPAGERAAAAPAGVGYESRTPSQPLTWPGAESALWLAPDSRPTPANLATTIRIPKWAARGGPGGSGLGSVSSRRSTVADLDRDSAQSESGTGSLSLQWLSRPGRDCRRLGYTFSSCPNIMT